MFNLDSEPSFSILSKGPENGIFIYEKESRHFIFYKLYKKTEKLLF